MAEKGSGDKTLLIIGHYDTVFPIGSTAAAMPWKVEGSKAFGPGIIDMKGGILQAGFAVSALEELGIGLNKKIKVVISGDEEPGSYTSWKLFESEAAKSDWAVVLEPGLAGLGDIKTARKGRAIYKLVAHGRASHSGNAPQAGINAVLELAEQVRKIAALNDYENGLSVSPTYMTAGMDDISSIPHKGHVTIDVRATKMDMLQKTDDAIRGLKPFLEGATLEVLGGIEKQPMEFTPASQDFFKHANSLAGELGFSLTGHTVGGTSDGNFAATTGIPILDGLGMTGEFMHNPGEYLNLDHLPYRIALLARIIQTL